MRKGLCRIAWVAAFVATTAAAHESATSGVCGEAQERQVAEFRFSQAQMNEYEECVKRQAAACGIETPGEAADKGIAGPLECRPQYCTEIALGLPIDSLNGPVCTLMSCGVVDDAWGRAAHMASDYCAAQPPAGSAVPQVLAPSTFLDPTYHHSLYSADQGLSGVCVQCADARP